MDRQEAFAGSTSERAIAVIAGLNTVTALAGAVGLAWGFLDLDVVSTSRLPWGSTVVAGVALALLVAAPNALLTVLAARRERSTGLVAVLVGTLLVLWILIELAFIRELSFFHPLYIGVGLALVWLGLRSISTWTGTTRRELWVQLLDVGQDLPLFVVAPLIRHWHLRWGATAQEVHDAMAGDGLLPVVSYRSTRAITIDAAPERVWPWLVQVGCGRAGFYADDLLDNLGEPSATTIVSDLQGLSPGDLVPMTASPTPETAFQVAEYHKPDWLLSSKSDSTWSWRLSPTGTGGTRLVTRRQASSDWPRPAVAALSWVLLEFGDFAMMRRMLRGIKHRAESSKLADESAAHREPGGS